MNIEQARFNMVEQQIRPWNVFDDTILNAMATIPREKFVPSQYRNLAFSDNEIPIGFNQVMMNPKIEARLLQALNIKKNETILEIGTGSGYLTALLANLARHVVTVEIIPELKEQAEAKFKTQGIVNITCEMGDASEGWPQSGPYDVIVVTGSLPVMQHELKESLNVGGRLFAVTGDGHAMSAQLIYCSGKNQFTQTSLFETELPPLSNVSHIDKFVF
ncbi:MAG: protein-L-isoaspartate O-methyltransferase [Gammaproteobacteria bacterium]